MAGEEAGNEESTGFAEGGEEENTEGFGAVTTSDDQNESAGGEESSNADDDSTGDGEGSGSEQEGGNEAPEQYEDFALPEGAVVDEDEMSFFIEDAREQGLSQDAAQGKLDDLLKWKERYDGKATEFWSKQQESWTAESRTEGLFKGEYMADAKHALGLLDPKGTTGQMLHQMGLDKNPVVIKAFAEYGRARREDTINSRTAEGGAATETPPEDVLFGD